MLFGPREGLQDTHFPYIMQALQAEKAVLTEKPISHELHEVVEAVELAKRKNLAFVCGYQRRFDRALAPNRASKAMKGRSKAYRWPLKGPKKPLNPC